MERLRAYLNSLPKAEQIAYASRCQTSLGYLRKAMSIGQELGEGLCILLDRESGGAVPCESLRPDIDWAYLRGTATGPKVAQQEVA
ncbi:transcriptional regulator [Bordetella petrii]|uniref:Uncharacterized protein n=1 Tax=Bordetella petrii (strain ATCC BAA-461 / DSM 12804 / CCUG 43448 / CIP 107267 / Se-1111R) TaxID=340100 RepID=A9I8W1_BORPD|nr:YdaS family helix-turn-helix protein [Bordetella petrii]CAP41296.1 Hypothetical protein Bpet0964 [Bordetella petrii]